MSFKFLLLVPLFIILCSKLVRLISLIMKDRVKLRKYLNSGINTVDKMTGEEFEDFLICHFKKLGYKGELTSKSHDYGADLILKKDGDKIVLQAKRYSGKVGIAAVQQIASAKSYYKADRAIVATNSYFTPYAENLAKSSGVELWDRNKLIEIMSLTEKNRCPICGGNLVQRAGGHGTFYGCAAYPVCKYTRNN
ncbi:MAG TPA: restriction endonuclease [Ruminiclostridium sp.]|nr:restriction endonuclease [Ruminiclostridium sp.]